MNIHSIKSAIANALYEFKQKRLCKKHMVILRVGDFICREDGTALGIFDGINIRHHGYVDGLQLRETDDHHC